MTLEAIIKNKLSLSAAAFLATAPMLLLGSSAAIAVTVEAPAGIDAEAPAADAGLGSEAPAQGLPGEEAEAEKAEAELAAPEFSLATKSDPLGFVLSDIRVPGISADQITNCGGFFDYGSAGGSTGPLSAPGPHVFDLGGSGWTQVTVEISCRTADGRDTPQTTKTVSFGDDGEIPGGENPGGDNPGEETPKTDDHGLGGTFAGTGAPAPQPVGEQLANTGGSSALVLGAAAAGTALLGAALLLARRFALLG